MLLLRATAGGALGANQFPVANVLLANAPNSIPPERVFSVLNDTFGDDMGNSMVDCIELSLQLQFNNR